MQTVRKQLAHTHYAKIENAIARIPKEQLSDGGLRLYVFLATMLNGQTITDPYIMKCLAISQKSLAKYKRELKLLDLVQVRKAGRGIYFIYVGSLVKGATVVEQKWSELDNDSGGTLTKEDMQHLAEKTISSSQSHINLLGALCLAE